MRTFIELNAYLERLGWMARLRRGDVIQLTTLPLPHRQFPGSRIHLYMWTASIITLLLSAVRWMDSGRPEGGWFTDSVYLDGLVGFALPILGTLLLASFVQTRVSAKFGVRSGHILPIPDPSVLLWLFSGLSTSYFIWPFGIFFIPTLPRMDARPWPDRGLIGMDFRVGSDCNAAFRIRVLVTRIVVDIRSVHVVKRTVSCESTVPH